MKIIVVGTGYVGIVTGACFAETGLTVTCIDIDKDKIEKLNKGIIPIYEPRLDEIVHKNIEKKRLFFSTNLKEHIHDCEAVIIAVGTPAGEDGGADLKYVLGVAGEIGQQMNHFITVITKSTVPIGTSNKVKTVIQRELSKRNVDIPFEVASNPEFLKEGTAVDDFLKPDRIIVGVESVKAQEIMEKLYKPFLLNGHPLLCMDIPSAEMTKYAANAMLATKISFMNEIANLCEIVGANVNWVRKGIGSDPRIGTKFIYPGIGYGGSCFPKDVKALIYTGDELQHPMQILKAVDKVNEKQKSILFDKIEQYFQGNLKNKMFAVWGLAFKPQTDDMREAPALIIINKLLKAGAKVMVYDPVAMNECKKHLGDKVLYSSGQYEALQNADALVLITEWAEFRLPDFDLIAATLKNKLIFDGRNIYDPHEMEQLGFCYYSIGRPVIN